MSNRPNVAIIYSSNEQESSESYNIALFFACNLASTGNILVPKMIFFNTLLEGYCEIYLIGLKSNSTLGKTITKKILYEEPSTRKIRAAPVQYCKMLVSVELLYLFCRRQIFTNQNGKCFQNVIW